MSNQTLIQKPNKEKEDLYLENFVVSDASTFNSQKGNALISIQLVGKKTYKPLPSCLYFGKRPFEEVESLKGQTVAFTFAVNERGMTISEVYPV